MKISIHKLSKAGINSISSISRFQLMTICLFFLVSFASKGQTGNFNWWNGTSGYQWAATDVSKSYTVSCGTGCVVTVTMTIIDPNNRNADPNRLTPHPFGDNSGTCGWITAPVNANGNPAGATGSFNDPWDSSCSIEGGLETETGGSYGLGYLTYGMSSFNHTENVTIRYTFSKPVFLSSFTVGDIDGRTLQQDRTDSQLAINPIDIRELPGNSYQDEVIVSASGPLGNVPVSFSAAGSLLIQDLPNQTVRSVYNSNTVNLTPDDARGTITVNTGDAITQLDITYSNGIEDAQAEQANSSWYNWWSGTHGATNGVSDDHAIRISGFTFQACPDFTYTRTNATVCPNTNATIGVTPSNGTAPYTYSWSGPNGFTSSSQNPVVSNVTAANVGTYTVTVYDSNLCFGTTTASVSLHATPTATITGTTNLTCTTTTVQRTAGGGGTYLWSNSLGTNAIANITSAGNYTVTVTNANGCTSTATTSVTLNNTPPVAGITGATNLTCTTTSVQRTATGGGTYLWSNSLGTSAIVNITSAGTYTVTVTDPANGCTSTATTVVTLNNTPPVAGITGTTNLTCTTTSIQRTATGGGTYSWSNSLGTTATVNITSAGTYTVTVTDPANGCTSTATTAVTLNNTPPVAGITGATNLTCTTTSVQRTATGGGTYLWSNSLGTSATVNITSAGTYTVTVTDPANGCTSTATTVVTLNNTPPVAGITGATNLTCTTTSVQRTATGGGTYLWSNSLGTSATVNITSAGTYKVTVTDPANGCTSTATTAVTLNNTPPVAGITGATNLTCTTTSVQRTATGGGTYLWSNSLGTSATVNITSAGTYTVTVTDPANGCTSTATTAVTLNNTPPVAGITGATNLTCTTTSIQRTATGGGTYLWSNSLGTSATVNITSAGTYTVTVTDPANGCTSTATTAVTLNNTPPVAGITGATNLTCTTTSVQRTATGGGTYLWSNSLGTSATVNITSAGTYTVTVTDPANGCTSTATTAVTLSNTPPVAGITGATNLTCTTTSVQRTATGGGTYLWSNGLGTSATVNITSAGTYTVTVTDPANGCTSTATTVVTLSNTSPVAGITGTTNLTCTTTSIQRTATGGGTYSWSNSLGTSATVSITSAGTYTVTVTDPANGCTSTATTAVTLNNTPPVAGITGTTNLTCTTTSVQRTATGGGTYLWSNSLGTSATVNITSAGTYTVTVTDPANGCTSTATTAVTLNNTPPVAGTTGTTNLTCTTTSIQRTATGGGTYLWSNSLGTSATVNITSSGTYTVTVTDPANGCTSTATTVVTLNDTPPTAAITGATNLTCTTTSIQRTATGGGTYLWSNGLGTSATVNITSAGTYTVTVTDPANGCTSTATTVVTLSNTPPVAGITGATNLTCTTTSVQRTATGGGTYSWSNSLGTSATVNITSAGNYTVTVTDPANGCTSTATTAVTLNNTPPVAGITGATNLTCTTTSVQRTATGGGTYLWSNGLGTSATVNITSAGTYTVTVTDPANGCTSTATTVVTIDTAVPTPSITGSNNLTCTTTTVQRTATGGGTYLWSNNLGTSATVDITSAGTYTVTVTNANGCSAIATTVVTLNDTPPVAGITGTTNLTCTTTSIQRTATGGGTYLWSNGLGTSATVNITSAGTYTVTVTDPTNGCTSTATTVVTINNTPPTVEVAGTDNLSCSGGLANRTATGGGTYLWNGPNSYTATSASIVLSQPGTYTVTVTDPINGCTATATTTVIVEPCGSIGDYVWSDTDNDGQQDTGEPALSGVKVYLLNASGVKLDSTLTDGSGKYLFDSLLSGNYRVQFVAPSGTIASDSNTGSDLTDSDANESGLSHLVNIDTSKSESDSLRNNLNIDAGFVPVGSIGDYVFADNNGDGIQNTGDSPVVGMKVYLLDAATGAKLDSTLTDSNGLYKFDSLLSGNYKVQFVVPVGSEPTLKTAGSDVTKDSNINPDGTTDAININTSLPIGDAGRNNTTIDAGIKPSYGSIGDYVWSDTDNDGQQDTGEPALSGVKVYLLNASGVKLDSVLTDGSGKYLFDSLLSGSYRVEFVAPSGTIASDSNTGSDLTDSDANESGLSHLVNIDTSKSESDSLRNNLNIDAGFVPVGSIGDYVFADNNGDGIQNTGDSPVVGMKVYLLDAATGAKLDSTLTDSNGLYKFDSLLTGSYKVQFVVPVGSEPTLKTAGSDVTKDSNINPDGTTDAISINTSLPIGDAGRNNTSVDAGIKPSYGSIGDYVWSDTDNDGQQDTGEPALSGVKVYLLNASGVKLDSVLTDGSGKYLFDSLLSGSYRVEFVAPSGTIASDSNTGSDLTDSDANESGLSHLVNIDTSKSESDSLRNNLNIDAGFVPVGSIGDYVFADNNGDGIQNTGDSPVVGMKVYLLDAATGAKLDSTLTDSNGLYKFDSLLTGSYKVQFVVPVGSEPTLKTAGSDVTKDSNINPDGTTDAISINTSLPIGDAGRNNTSVDAGIKPSYGSIGDYVWSDTDNDGQQDTGEPALSGVKVYLLNASGVKLDSVLTDGSGKYLFDSLLSGSYRVQFVAPAGTIASDSNTGSDLTDSDANESGLSHLVNIDTSKSESDSLRNNLNIDAGFVPVGSIGDYVFADNNGDGIQNTGDSPVVGMKVYLLDAATGAKLDSTLTDSNGLYKFDSLLTGSYKVQFVVPVGSEPTLKTAGSDVTKDSNINPDGTTDAISINTSLPIGDAGRNNTSVDAGIKPSYGSIGDYVWSDTDNDGQQDTGEPALSGVKVYLLNASGVKLDSVLTDGSGKYLFDSLLSGSYRVEFVAPSGTIASDSNTGSDLTDSDANESGLSHLVNIDTSKSESDSLRNNLNIDAGFVPVGSIGDYVFADNNGDGIQNTGDSPVVGMKVYLLDAATGAKLDSTLTDSNGLYKFDSLLTGSYKVQFVVPVGSEPTLKTAGSDVTKDSNINPDGTTDAISINTSLPIGDAGRNNTSVDAGIKPSYGSIGDYVWSDTDNDGQQDTGEPALSGVKVYLLNASGVKLDSVLTDGSGKYLFDSLLSGSYRVQFVAPAGTIASDSNTGSDLTDSDANESGLSHLVNIDTSKSESDSLRNNLNIDAGFVPVGSIGDYVFADNNGDGIQNTGDSPVVGMKVYLLDATTGAKLDSTLTDSNGLYKFDSLLTGSYKVQFVVPVGSEPTLKTAGSDVTKDSNINPDGTTDAISINTSLPIGDAGRNNTSVDAGIKPSYGSIGDYVWSDTDNDGQQDTGEPAISGVKVYLLNASGVKLDSTLTDGSGKYLFDSLLSGSYQVQFVAPAGTIASDSNTGSDLTDSDANESGLSHLVNIDTSKSESDSLRNNLNIDAGFVPVGSIGDYVFADNNGDGIQNTGDSPVSGMKVYLLDAATGAKLDSTLTDSNGLYKFDSLLTGSYKVQFVVPVGSEPTLKTAGSDVTKDSNINPDGTTDAISINTSLPIGDAGRNNTSVDAGIKPSYGSIGDYVWSDTDNDGQQDTGEPALSGVKVYLLNASGVKLDSVLTDGSGKYLFDSLLSGSYRVQFVAPAGTIASDSNTGSDLTDSDANESGLSHLVNIDTSKSESDSLRNNLNIDAGFVPVGSIGDYVFADNNGDGIQNTGDSPVVGMKVYLLDATTGAKLDSTLTDSNGLYKFDSLLTGSYKVQFVVPVGSEPTLKTAGSDVTKDSNINPDGTTDAISINTSLPIGDAGRNNTSVDAGIKPSYGSIGDYVWSDTDNDGQQDTGEPAISGVKVYLLNASGVKLDSTLTDGSGKYLFDSLLSGSYQVQFVAPAGTIASDSNTGSDLTDSDANESGLSHLVNIDTSKSESDSLRNNLNIDAGFVPVGSIGDYVFQDKDNSGTQTVGDLPISGVKVYLLDATTGAKLDSTITDSNGLYKFDSLLSGSYKVQVEVPTGMSPVTKDTGVDDTKDSDVDPTGRTGVVTIDTTKPVGDPLRDNTSTDAGLKGNPVYGSIGDYVWTDSDNDGVQDVSESPLSGVKVYLYDGTGTVKLDSALTDAAGKYLFDSLLTGEYKVKFVAPVGTIASKPNVGSDVSDSDASGTGWSHLINIDVTKPTTDSLRNNLNIDAGFVPVGSIGDYVFQDKDNSGTQTVGDLPISGVKVYLLDATTGAKLDSTITDSNGLYKFDSLLSGSYKVQVEVPTGMSPVTKDTGVDDTKDSDVDPTGTTGVVTIDTTKPVGDPLRDNTSTDAGLKGNPVYGSIGDYVWTDSDNDGVQDVSESPLSGVKVYLYDGTGTVKLDSALTDAAGKYLFDSLLTGEYKVKFVAPVGTIASKSNVGSDVSDSDANGTGWSQLINIDVTKPESDSLRNNLNIDAGFVPVGSIGDYVFADKDNSGTQTVGDLPISGVKVYLLDATTGAKLDSTITDSNGLYKFDSLLSGSYKVQVEVPTGMSPVTKDTGVDDTKDSDVDLTGTTGVVTIDTTKPVGDPLRDNTSTDAGLKGNPVYGSIGDYVWTDSDNDGVQDVSESPLSGVKVYLYDGTGTVKLDSALTDAAGKYLFDSLLTGEYKVKFVAPAGTIASKSNVGSDVSDSDANGTGWSQLINIYVTKPETDSLRNNLNIDAGFVPVGSIGDYVFQDKDNSGTQTVGDLPISGVKVYLLDATTGAKLDSTITDSNGLYKFDSLLSGSYKVQVEVPTGMSPVTKDTGLDDTKDSDVDPTGTTGVVTIDTTKPFGDPLRDNTSTDAGLKVTTIDCKPTICVPYIIVKKIKSK